MYSFQPIPAVDTLNSHVGFLLYAFFSFFLWIGMVFSGDWKWWGAAVILAIPLGIIGAISWNTGSIKTYANTQVTGTLVGFTAESHNESRGSGKTTHTVTVRNLYVTYQVGENVVVLPASAGSEYPKTAVLYKN